LIAARLASESRDFWVDRFRGAGVPCGSVRDVAEVLNDPQIEAREMVRQIEHDVAGAIRVTGVPIKLSATPGAVRTPPPLLGEHTNAVLSRDARYTESEIAALRSSRAI
jgi:CoA:oxalate CoA-transferase